MVGGKLLHIVLYCFFMVKLEGTHFDSSNIYDNLGKMCVVEESIADRVAEVCGLGRTPSPFMALR